MKRKKRNIEASIDGIEKLTYYLNVADDITLLQDGEYAELDRRYSNSKNSPNKASNEVLLHGSEKAFRWRIIPALSTPTHRLQNAGVLKVLHKLDGRVLTALVGVEHRAGAHLIGLGEGVRFIIPSF